MTPDLNTVYLKPGEREEMEQLFAHTRIMRDKMAHDPEVARQFLKEIGLLDADGGRVKLEGEENGTSVGHNGTNGHSR